MATKLKACALACSLGMLPLGASGAGLGKLTVLSVLGQPFRAELSINATREELSSLTARIAAPDAFKQAGIDYIPAFAGMRFTIEKRANGQPFLSIHSDRPLNEPFLDLLVQIDWASGRLVREYTVLLDPPEALQAVTAPVNPPVAAASVAQRSVRTETEPRPSAAEPPRERAPRASEAAAQQKAPRPGETVTRVVKRGETLAKIARETAPPGVSLEQMLVALYRENQDAFEGHNMNRLLAGKILNIPAPGVVTGVGASDASKTVVAHAADFNAYRQKLASAAAAGTPREELASQMASGKIVPRVEEKTPPPVAGKDKLAVSKSGPSVTEKGVAGTAAARAMEEDLVARDRALKEANNRIAELEKNINDLRKLVELKSQSMAELEKQAQGAKLAAGAARTEPPAASAKPPAPGVPPQPVAVGSAPVPVPAPPLTSPAQPAPPSQPVELAQANAPTPVNANPAERSMEAAPASNRIDPPAPVAKPPSAEQLVPVEKPGNKAAAPVERSFMADNPGIVYGGAGILALVLAYAGYASWRRRTPALATEAPSRIAPSEVATNSVFGATGGQSVDTSSSLQTDFSQSGMGTIDTDEGVDPVAEADVYMAYGRDVQAEEILLDALKTDPTRPAIHLKLLEIYAARKSLKQFETVASEFYAQTGGTGPDWEKAVPLIEKMDPENPLYGRKAGKSAADELVLAPADRGDTIALPGELGQIADAVATADTHPLSVPGIGAPMPEELPQTLDFDLDLGTADAAPQPAAEHAPEPAPQPASVASEQPALQPAVLIEEQAPSEYESMKTLVVPRAQTDEPAEALDLELQATDIGIKVPVVSEAPVAEAASAGFDLDVSAPQQAGEGEEVAVIELERTDARGAKPLDFNFEFGADTVPKAPPAVVDPPRPTASPMSFDLSSISLDLGDVPEETRAPSAAVLEEIATKLELATAYEEMGDKEGARELLQEVINEGDAAQQASARSKLAQLA